MPIPDEWMIDERTIMTRMIDLVHSGNISRRQSKQVMAELLERGWVYAGDKGFGFTDKGLAEVFEDMERQQGELCQEARNYNAMSENEREAFMSKAVSFHFPKLPSDASHEECKEVLAKTMQLLGFEWRQLDDETRMLVAPTSIN